MKFSWLQKQKNLFEIANAKKTSEITWFKLFYKSMLFQKSVRSYNQMQLLRLLHIGITPFTLCDMAMLHLTILLGVFFSKKITGATISSTSSQFNTK